MSKSKLLGLAVAILLVAWLFIRSPQHDARAIEDTGPAESGQLTAPLNAISLESDGGNRAADHIVQIESAGSEVHSRESEAYPASYLLEAPLIGQLPELYNGCEITSLAMLLAYLGLPADKMELASLLEKDETPAQFDEEGNIVVWGDPDVGFVEDIYGNALGYGVYAKPLAKLLTELYEPGALDLTGHSFEEIEKTVSAGKPVIVWNIASFEESDAMITWKTPEGKDVEATFQEHCVLLVGYDEEYVYINNPFEEIQSQAVPKWSFLEAWEQMGSKALTVQ